MKKTIIIITLIFTSLLFVSCRDKFDFTTIQLAGTEWKAENKNVLYTLSFDDAESLCTLITRSINYNNDEELLYEKGFPYGLYDLFLKKDNHTKYVGQFVSKNTLYLTEWDNDQPAGALPKFTLKK